MLADPTHRPNGRSEYITLAEARWQEDKTSQSLF